MAAGSIPGLAGRRPFSPPLLSGGRQAAQWGTLAVAGWRRCDAPCPPTPWEGYEVPPSQGSKSG